MGKGTHSVGLMWWMLAREVLRLRGTISRNLPWETDVMPDLFFYRDPEEQKEEAAKAEAAKIEAPVAENWGGDVADDAALAAAAPAATPVPAASAAAASPAPAAATPAAAPAGDDWNQAVDDWATATPATATGDDWGGEAAGNAW